MKLYASPEEAAEVADELDTFACLLEEAIDRMRPFAGHDPAYSCFWKLEDMRAEIRRAINQAESELPNPNAEHRSAYLASLGVRT